MLSFLADQFKCCVAHLVGRQAECATQALKTTRACSLANELVVGQELPAGRAACKLHAGKVCSGLKAGTHSQT
jgi:hypothetical protein